MIIKQQLKLIDEIQELRAGNKTGIPPLEVFSLLFELEKLGTAPHIAEKEYFRKLYQAEARKNIPNLNELEKVTTEKLLAQMKRFEDNQTKKRNYTPIPNLNDLQKYYESKH